MEDGRGWRRADEGEDGIDERVGKVTRFHFHFFSRRRGFVCNFGEFNGEKRKKPYTYYIKAFLTLEVHR